MSIWDAAGAGDLGGVEWLVGQDPGLLNAKDRSGMTPLMRASVNGHLDVVRWLLRKGAPINERDDGDGATALWHACWYRHIPVVLLLLERGANPAIAPVWGETALAAASARDHLEVMHLLLAHPSAKATINRRDILGKTAPWEACYRGRAGAVRALLESGADPTIAKNNGMTPWTIAVTPMAIAKAACHGQQAVFSEGRRECVTALEVRYLYSSQLLSLPAFQLAEA
jgi:uncharacterized protein